MLDLINKILGLIAENLEISIIGSLVAVSIPITIVIKNKNNDVIISDIKLYAIDRNSGEKVYTINIRKDLSRTFGIEIHMKNNTRKDKNVKFKWCIYKGKRRVGARISTRKVEAGTPAEFDIEFEYRTYRNLTNGSYRSVLLKENEENGKMKKIDEINHFSISGDRRKRS